jgi:hypothetical protein
MLLVSCSSDNPLVGTWRFESVEVAEGSARNIPPAARQLWDSRKDQMKLEISGGGSFVSTLDYMYTSDIVTREGKWRQSEDGKTFYLQHEGSETELQYTIAELTETRLKLLWASNDMVLVLTRVAQ